jgi:hypothetical protein
MKFIEGGIHLIAMLFGIIVLGMFLFGLYYLDHYRFGC